MRIDTPEDLRTAMGTPYVVSDAQWAAISAPLEPAVVIAGAGSGKTELMAARVVFLVQNGLVRPDEVLGLTFTTKATSELRERIRRYVPPGPDALEPTIATYNAYAANLLTEQGLRIGHEPDVRVMADASRYQLAARAIARHRGRVQTLSDHPPTVIDNLLALEGAISEHLQTTDAVREHDAALRPRVDEALAEGPKGDLGKVVAALDKRAELLGLVDDYRRLKDELGLMDFSDQVALTARLVAEHPAVGRGERERFRIVLLDEYQDTSVAQAQLLAGLFSGPAGDGRGHAVTAVGDPNQAIYGWRGASVSNILRFPEQFRTRRDTEARVFPLVVNRRSDRRILEVANHVAAPLYARFPQVAPLEPKPDAEPGTVNAIVHETYAEELEWLTAQVLAAHDAGTAWGEIGVLTRDNANAADVFDVLSRAEVPVEIVGLNGLLRLPEVAEVVATLTVLADPTANAALLQVLAGPRWAIGPRDLALLGRRARDLVGAAGPREAELSLSETLEKAVEGADPVDLAALADALADPGEPDEYAYSASARERFALLDGELRRLRLHVGEPLLDLVRRIIDVTGIDVELASSVSPAAAARRENLDHFVRAVADFTSVDGAQSLPALLAWLEAEDEMGEGLDVATPSESDSVKLLTVHRAKGLEYDVVFLPGWCEEKFPHKTLRTQWTTGHAVLPIALRGDWADLPSWRDLTAAGLKAFTEEARRHQHEEELRLAYVALTRARHVLHVSSYLWIESRKTAVGPSPFQGEVRDAMAAWGGEPEVWLEKPPKDAVNPTVGTRETVVWPVTERSAEAQRRLRAAELVTAVDPAAPDGDLGEHAALVAGWDEEIDRLMAEHAARDAAAEVVVPLPPALSATALSRLRADPDGFARELVRPMPRRPSPAARFGSRFHAWVEARFGQQSLLEVDRLSGRGDADVSREDEADLEELIARFTEGPFGDRAPAAVEAPFALVLAGQVVRGRIDAVYAEHRPGAEPGFLVVDWKTNARANADPLQLAVYRVAWADLHGIPVERVRAGFYYVRTGELVEPPDLPGRAALERLLVGAPVSAGGR
ncbi:ATP-dependent helicase [Nocardioides sp. GY 10113]|uniref:UvrD-helicase domain-containing protein n=1 Tax=Nocardioides sp. GY 10113 TaxID=2569761 RepID=UPI0010A8DCF8|nr:UvrD-helicase domain-containing protein [Nocardioides sp. GY 10113]TIC81272.1 ATP-dependent helicase [Nocardioides sp. GY 10113]